MLVCFSFIVIHMTYAIYLTPKAWAPIATCRKWCKKNVIFKISIQANILIDLFKVLWLSFFTFTFAQAKEVKVACSFVLPNILVLPFLSYPFWSQLCLTSTSFTCRVHMLHGRCWHSSLHSCCVVLQVICY